MMGNERITNGDWYKSLRDMWENPIDPITLCCRFINRDLSIKESKRWIRFYRFQDIITKANDPLVEPIQDEKDILEVFSFLRESERGKTHTAEVTALDNFELEVQDLEGCYESDAIALDRKIGLTESDWGGQPGESP